MSIFALQSVNNLKTTLYVHSNRQRYDRQGLPLSMSEPVAGNHNDLHDIEVQFEVVTATLEQADISVDGLFLNADAGFDSKNFRQSCSKKEVNANICFNKRNGNADRDEYFVQIIVDGEMKKDYSPN